MKKSYGFTIVELAVIIAVIGILSTIAVFTYSGAQERAQNTKTQVAAKDYLGALTLYSNRYGSYPEIPSGGTMCLGVMYPTDANGPLCTTLGTRVATSLQLIDLVDGIAPEPGSTTYTGSGFSVSGVMLWRDNTQIVDGQLQAWWLIYALQGAPAKDACPVGKVAYGNRGSFTLTPPSSGIRGVAHGNGHLCYVPLPYDR